MDGLQEQAGIRRKGLTILPAWLQDNPLPAIWQLTLLKRRRKRPIFQFYSAAVLFFQVLALLCVPAYLIDWYTNAYFLTELLMAESLLSFFWLLLEFTSCLNFAGNLMRSETSSTFPIIDEALAASSLQDRDFILAMLQASLPRLMIPSALLCLAVVMLFQTDFLLYSYGYNGLGIAQWLSLTTLSMVSMSGLLLLHFGLGMQQEKRFAASTGTVMAGLAQLLTIASWFLTYDEEWMTDFSSYWRYQYFNPHLLDLQNYYCNSQLGMLLIQFMLVLLLLHLATHNGWLRRLLLLGWPALCGILLTTFLLSLQYIDPENFSYLTGLRFISRAGQPLSFVNLDVIYMHFVGNDTSVQSAHVGRLQALTVLLQFAYAFTFLQFARRMLSIHRRGTA
ncbi:MAG: hypothetical protein H7A35_15855 [Planctomycetales bacterium]|nr:hypothetical protein [bacterium]UNM08303.1 MAG: hypothetical protein H7A35_15855 [Planctomycetales bacterium]